MGAINSIRIMREKVERNMLPDTCQIYPLTGGNRQIVGGVMTSDDPAPLVWRVVDAVNITVIPCRNDIYRAYAPDKLKTQPTIVSQYTIELPYDAPVTNQGNFLVTNGRRFEIRKIKDASEWDVTIEVTATEVSTRVDHFVP